MSQADDLRAEFTRLRRGAGSRRQRLITVVGPGILRWLDVNDDASDHDIRSRIVAELDAMPTHRLDHVDSAIVRAALALDHQNPFGQLLPRLATVPALEHQSERHMRRKMTAAFDVLVDAIVEADRSASAADPDKGWRVRRLSALLRLDGPEPTVHETKTIVATRDGLRTVAARFSLPVIPERPDRGRELITRVMAGATLLHQSREGSGHFLSLLRLPTPLNRGDEHTFSMEMKVTDGHPIRDHYACVPYVTVAAFDVRVRFGADRPHQVWRFERVSPRVLYDRHTRGTFVPLDEAGEVGESFQSLEPPWAYGIGWTPR